MCSKEVNRMINIQKAAVIGCGFVGSTIAYTLMQKGTFSELVLIDAVQAKEEGEAMDISHGLPFAHAMDINCEGILMIVSNPVDILTQVALKESGFPKERVIGSGTVLDTARLKYLISEKLDVDSRNVHAFIAGEHGDSELAVWSCANVYGIGIKDFAKMRGFSDFSDEMDEIYHAVRDSAYEIIERKGATYYGIGMAAARIAEAIVRDSHAVVPISVSLNGEYGLDGLCLSIPTIIGNKGAEQVLEINLSDVEMEKLKKSAEELKAVLAQIEE